VQIPKIEVTNTHISQITERLIDTGLIPTLSAPDLVLQLCIKTRRKEEEELAWYSAVTVSFGTCNSVSWMPSCLSLASSNSRANGTAHTEDSMASLLCIRSM